MRTALQELKEATKKELAHILKYWEEHTLDTKYGGFIGHIAYPDQKKPLSNKGVILNSRILWTFSAASNFYKDNRYELLCQRSFDYLKTYFKDTEYGGVFWEVNYKGEVVHTKKQVYAQAFMVYALSEYYLFSNNEESKAWAIEIFNLIENYALDHQNGGYIEAFDQQWNHIEDMRLSEKDDNTAKTMNTHLHLLEAYTVFFKIYPENQVKEAIKKLIHLFLNVFLDKIGHFNLFFDEKWNLKSNVYSYGHDIEAAWLLVDAAEAIQDEKKIDQVKNIVIKIADRCIQVAIDDDGGVMNEENYVTGDIDKDRHWWPQAEGVVGLYYAYQITGEQRYLETAKKIWEFISSKMIDQKYGEWFWRIDANGHHNPKDEKVGMWKCPYHNSRACMQLHLYDVH